MSVQSLPLVPVYEPSEAVAGKPAVRVLAVPVEEPKSNRTPFRILCFGLACIGLYAVIVYFAAGPVYRWHHGG